MRYKLLLWLLSIIFLVATMSGALALGENGLSSYYAFESSAVDELGAYNGTATGVTFIPGFENNASYYDGGAGDKIELAAAQSNSKSAGTIAFWMKFDAESESYNIFAKNSANFRMQYVTANDDVYFQVNAEGSTYTNVNKDWTQWTHVVASWNGSKKFVWIDGVEEINATASVSTPASGNLFLGQNSVNTNEDLKGYIDELSYWDVTFEQANVTELYNSGSGIFYPFSVVGNYTITVVDEWDSSAVNNITVNISDYNVYTNTTGNTVYTNITVNESLLFDINVTGQDYFSKSFSNQNLSADSSLELFQSQINFSAYELITENNLNNVSFTVDSQTNGTFPLKAGVYNVTASKDGYYNLTQEITIVALDNYTINITGMYNNEFNLTLTHGVGGADITNITGWIYNSDNNYNSSFSSNNIPNIEGLNYTLYVNPSGYTSNQSIITTSGTIYNYSIVLYAFNSLYIEFRDSQTEAIINNVSLDYWSNSDSGSNSTSTGSLYLTLLDPESYTLRYNSTGYPDNFYFTSISNDTYNNLTLYLNSNTTEITIEIIDGGAAPVENATVQAQMFYVTDNTYRTVASGVTNPDGKTVMDLVTGSNFYKFVVIYEGETKKITNPFVITGTTVKIQIFLEDPSLTTYNTLGDISGLVVFNPSSNNFRYTFSDSSMNNREYCLNTYRRGSNTDTLINNTCTSGSSGTILQGVTNTSGLTYYSIGTVSIDGVARVIGQDSHTFPLLNLGSAGLLIQIILSLAFATAGFLAIELIFLTVPISIIIGGLVGLHAISLSFTAPLVVIGLFFMFMLRRNR